MPLGQQVQIAAHNGQGGAVLPDTEQLQLQALGQVFRPHSGGLQLPKNLQCPLQQGEGKPAVLGQLGQLGGEIAPVVQAGGQVAYRVGQVLIQVHGVELAGQEAE